MATQYTNTSRQERVADVVTFIPAVADLIFRYYYTPKILVTRWGLLFVLFPDGTLCGWDSGLVEWRADVGGKLRIVGAGGVKQLASGITDIVSGGDACVALTADGHIMVWRQLKTTKDTKVAIPYGALATALYESPHGFCAAISGGRVATWSTLYPKCETISFPEYKAPAVDMVLCNDDAYAALMSGGKVHTWGSREHGGDSHAVTSQLVDVVQICKTRSAFSARRANGTVITWGVTHPGGNSPVNINITNAVQLYSTLEAFAARLDDGSVVAWGEGPSGDSSTVHHHLSRVVDIRATAGAFAARTADGRVVTWGENVHGGDSTAAQPYLTGAVHDLYASGEYTFTAVTSENAVTWGGYSTVVGICKLGSDHRTTAALGILSCQLVVTDTGDAVALGGGSLVLDNVIVNMFLTKDGIQAAFDTAVQLTRDRPSTHLRNPSAPDDQSAWHLRERESAKPIVI